MNIRRIIRKNVNSIPPLPEVIIKLREYINDPDVDYRKLAEIIEREQGLTVNILRLANSAYFGGMGQIKSIQLAMTRLGLRRIHQMAVAVCIEPFAAGEIKGYDLGPRALWSHSLATALTAEAIAAESGMTDTADAFTAGLLHDIGKTVLGNFAEVDLRKIMSQVDEREISFDDAEREVMGVDHAEVAAILLSRWKIPQEIVEAVRWHHRPALLEGDDTLVSLVHMADILAMDMGIGMGGDGQKYRLDEHTCRKFKMSPQIGDRIICKVTCELAEMMDMFSIRGEESSNVFEHSHS